MNLATGSPFGEFSLKKNFNLEFKPLPFKPIQFIKEKWSPFGKFGKRLGIQKRDLDKIAPGEEKGLLENRLPVEVHEAGPLGPITFPRQEIGRVPIMQSPIRPNLFLPLGIGPVPAPPPPEVVITPPPPQIGRIPGLNTNIARDQLIDGYLKEVGQEVQVEALPHEVNIIEKPLSPKIEEPGKKEEDNPFVRGSKLAIYFGSLLLDIMSRFLGRPVAPVKE